MVDCLGICTEWTCRLIRDLLNVIFEDVGMKTERISKLDCIICSAHTVAFSPQFWRSYIFIWL